MNNMPSGIAEGLFNLFGTRTPSPPNMSPVGSPRGPVHSYGPGGAPISPTVDNPDMKLAEELVGKSSIAKILPEYRNDVILALLQQLPVARDYPGAHTDEELIKMAGHPCVIVWIQTAIAVFEEEKSMEIKEHKKSGVINGVALVLAQGFDKVQEPNPKRPFFERDASGRIIGILNTKPGQPNARFSGCNQALQRIPLMGGKRRKTKKQQKKKRKTLRRRKLHR